MFDLRGGVIFFCAICKRLQALSILPLGTSVFRWNLSVLCENTRTLELERDFGDVAWHAWISQWMWSNAFYDLEFDLVVMKCSWVVFSVEIAWEIEGVKCVGELQVRRFFAAATDEVFLEWMVEGDEGGGKAMEE